MGNGKLGSLFAAKGSGSGQRSFALASRGFVPKRSTNGWVPLSFLKRTRRTETQISYISFWCKASHFSPWIVRHRKVSCGRAAFHGIGASSHGQVWFLWGLTLKACAKRNRSQLRPEGCFLEIRDPQIEI